MKMDYKCNNGMQIIYDQNNSVHSVSMAVFFKIGNLAETEKNCGITHLVEHLFFRNLNGINNDDLYYKLLTLGTELRGRTFRDFVCFEINVISENFIAAFELMLNLFADFSWNFKDIEAEKAVVKKQIDCYYQSFDSHIDYIFFKNRKYQGSIMGNKENVNNFSTEEINQWKKKYFNCSNSCMVFCGDISNDNIVYVKEKLSHLHNDGYYANDFSLLPKDLFKRSEKSDNIFASNDTVSDVWITFDIDLTENDLFYVSLLSSILGGHDGSKLPFLLTDTYALTDLITSVTDLFPKFARIKIQFSVLNKELLKSLDLVLSEILNLSSNISERDFNKNIMFFTRNINKEYDDVSSLAFNYGWYDFILKHPYEMDIKKIKYADAKKVLIETAHKIFCAKNMSVNIYNNSRIIKKSVIKCFLNDFRASINE